MRHPIPSLVLGAALCFAPLFTTASEQRTDGAPAWTPAALRSTLAAMPGGDTERGASLHEELMCASCHGAQGVAPTRNYNHLAGQRAEYNYKMLLDYRAGRRDEGSGQAAIMVEIARLLSDQDAADLAAFYAEQPLPGATTDERVSDAHVLELVRRGDPQRLITPCAACHGLHGQGGVNETPMLAGQERTYFIRTMTAFRDGQRDNDVFDGMAQFARALSDEEIEALADHYAGVPANP